jgi:DNA-binding GntR family transcriptional regulator
MEKVGSRPGLGPQRISALAKLMERDISYGDLAAGSWLKQVDLEERYEATRTEVRQALDRLAEKGLVRHLARRGYRVEEFDPERLAQTMEIQGVLEAAAAAHVIHRLDEASLEAMYVQAERLRRGILEGTVEEQEEANLEFHRIMLAPCPNREMVNLLFELRARIPAAARRKRNSLGHLQRVSAHHFEMIRLIRERDLPGLQHVMIAHNYPYTPS